MRILIALFIISALVYFGGRGVDYQDHPERYWK